MHLQPCQLSGSILLENDRVHLEFWQFLRSILLKEDLVHRQLWEIPGSIFLEEALIYLQPLKSPGFILSLLSVAWFHSAGRGSDLAQTLTFTRALQSLGDGSDSLLTLALTWYHS